MERTAALDPTTDHTLNDAELSVFERSLSPFILRESQDSHVTYMAGLPDYPGNFTRDEVTADLIGASPVLVISQLRKSARHLGTSYNSLTGEAPGKAHHEFPGVDLAAYGRPPELLTAYNSTDATRMS